MVWCRCRLGAYWRHMANTSEPSVCSGNVASCKITLTSCLSRIMHGQWYNKTYVPPPSFNGCFSGKPGLDGSLFAFSSTFVQKRTFRVTGLGFSQAGYVSCRRVFGRWKTAFSDLYKPRLLHVTVDPIYYGQTIIFSCCGFFLSFIFFPRLVSAAAHWMSTILRHMVWP